MYFDDRAYPAHRSQSVLPPNEPTQTITAIAIRRSDGSGHQLALSTLEVRPHHLHLDARERVTVFIQEGGIRERMTKARLQYRNNPKGFGNPSQPKKPGEPGGAR